MRCSRERLASGILVPASAAPAGEIPREPFPPSEADPPEPARIPEPWPPPDEADRPSPDRPAPEPREPERPRREDAVSRRGGPRRVLRGRVARDRDLRSGPA